MKCFKKLVSLVAAAALLTVLPGANALQAEAAEPTTYYIKYDLDQGQWRMQIGEWLNDYEGRELYYLNEGSEKVKDGDTVVILANEEKAAGPDISINARLGNLTVNRTSVVIKANGMDNWYVLGESDAAISGNVTNGYVYDDAKCTFNNDVTSLRMIASVANDVDVDVSVKGTVGYAAVENGGGVLREYFNFVAGKFYYDHASGLMTAVYPPQDRHRPRILLLLQLPLPPVIMTMCPKPVKAI